MSTKNLLRILIIVGIGIPVLVEVFTAFELFSIHIGEEKQHRRAHTAKSTDRRVAEGRRLIPDSPPVIEIENMRILAGPRSWIFEMELELEHLPDELFQLKLEKLKLKGGEIIQDPKVKTWKSLDDEGEFELSWSIPPGETPLGVTVTARTQLSSGKSKLIEHDVVFGNVPVFYHSAQDEE